jgi:hypothetical protein
LSINIYSKNPESGETNPVADSVVHVSNSEIGLDTEKETDENGNATFMGSNIRYSIQKYEITLSKSGYEAVLTMPPYPATSYNPTDVHASVVLGAPNVVNIAQNKLADLKITAVNFLDQPIPNINFHIKGGRKMGTTIGSNDPVYNLDGSSKTGSGGEKEYNDISPGQYEIIPSLGGTNYELVRLDPVSPYTLLSENPATVKIELADKNTSSLLVVVTGDDGEPVSGANVQLKNDTLGYDSSLTTPDDGKVFFPTSADLFQPGMYDLKITASGYDESNVQTTINLNELKIETVSLTAS